jgi:hypothetical protein
MNRMAGGGYSMSQIKYVSGDELTYLAASIAVAISKGLDNSDINVLAKFLKAIGENLDIIGASNTATLESVANSANSKRPSGQGTSVGAAKPA